MTKKKRINRNEEFIKAFGNNLRVIRKEQGLSQEKLANKCDLWLSIVGRIERGEIDITLSTVKKLAEGLHLSVDALFHFSK